MGCGASSGAHSSGEVKPVTIAVLPAAGNENQESVSDSPAVLPTLEVEPEEPEDTKQKQAPPVEPSLSEEERQAMQTWIQSTEDFMMKDWGGDFDAQMQAAGEIYRAHILLPGPVKQTKTFIDATHMLSQPLGAGVISYMGVTVKTTREEKERKFAEVYEKYPWYRLMCGDRSRGSSLKRGEQCEKANPKLDLLPQEEPPKIGLWDLEAFEAKACAKGIFGRRYSSHFHPDGLTYFADGKAVVDFINSKLSPGERYSDPGFRQICTTYPQKGFLQNYDAAAVFRDGLDPNDIMQGCLGNCWLISTIAVVASWPQLLRSSIYPNDRLSPSGAYAVKFHSPEWGWVWVVIDAFFPCDTRFGRCAFGGSRDNLELWPMLIEKAFAKIHNGYENMVGGEASCMGYGPAFTALTSGKTYCSHMNTEPKTTLNTAAKVSNYLGWCALKSQRLLCASCYGGEHLGLVPNHAYSVLSVYGVPDTEPRVTLVNLRNPWGRREWSGAWSNRDHENWTKNDRHVQIARFREHFDWEKIAKGERGSPEDGEFYMPVEDFFKYFRHLYTCHIPFKFDVGAGFNIL